jgi:hypothetical protein
MQEDWSGEEDRCCVWARSISSERRPHRGNNGNSRERRSSPSKSDKPRLGFEMPNEVIVRDDDHHDGHDWHRDEAVYDRTPDQHLDGIKTGEANRKPSSPSPLRLQIPVPAPRQGEPCAPICVPGDKRPRCAPQSQQSNVERSVWLRPMTAKVFAALPAFGGLGQWSVGAAPSTSGSNLSRQGVRELEREQAAQQGTKLLRRLWRRFCCGRFGAADQSPLPTVFLPHFRFTGFHLDGRSRQLSRVRAPCFL